MYIDIENFIIYNNCNLKLKVMKRNSRRRNAKREESSLVERLFRLIFFEPDLGASAEKSVRTPALKA